MQDVVVRVMRPDEFDEMRAVSVAAFTDESIGVLLDALRTSWAWHDELCFVAEQGGRLVGQVLYTEALLDAPHALTRVLVLSPVGILPEFHGQGLGTTLINESLEAIVDRPEPAIFLEGNPAYYARFGFEPGGDHGFRKPSLRIPDRAFQVRPQSSWSPGLSGTLVYQDAFWLTDSVGLR
ncbi:MAG: putative acetyltransferase [Acidimicrobiales bacterium]|jgi:putative acetyltransferase